MATDKPMQLGIVGLGRMGANLARRLMRDGHECVVFGGRAGECGGRARGRRRHRCCLDGGVRPEADGSARGLGDGPRRRYHREDPSTIWRPHMESGDMIIDACGNS